MKPNLFVLNGKRSPAWLRLLKEVEMKNGTARKRKTHLSRLVRLRLVPVFYKPPRLGKTEIRRRRVNTAIRFCSLLLCYPFESRCPAKSLLLDVNSFLPVHFKRESDITGNHFFKHGFNFSCLDLAIRRQRSDFATDRWDSDGHRMSLVQSCRNGQTPLSEAALPEC